jgi:hypothetical protein
MLLIYFWFIVYMCFLAFAGYCLKKKIKQREQDRNNENKEN